MKSRYEWNTLIKIGAVTVGSLVSLIAIYISFYIKFMGKIPARNFLAFESSYPWIVIGFIIINILFGTYIFYNKSKIDILFFTIFTA